MKKILSLFLVMIALLTCGVSVNAKESRELSSAAAQYNTGVVYTRVSSDKNLKTGDRVLIASNSGTYSLGNPSGSVYDAIETGEGSTSEKILGTSNTVELEYEACSPRTGKFKFPNSNEYLGTNPYVWSVKIQLGNLFLSNDNDYLAFEGSSFTCTNKLNDYNKISLYKRTESFTNVEAKASLKITYAEGKPDDVDLRFGGIISKSLFDSSAKYGVIVLTDKELDKYKADSTTTLATLISAKAAYEIIPANVTDGYQFAWVITNMEDHFDTKLNAWMYKLKDGKVELSRPKMNTSAVDVANIYIGTEENPNPYGLSDQILNTLKNINKK